MSLKIRTKIILLFFAPILPLTVIVVIVSGYLLNNLYNKAQRLDDISKERIKVTDLRLSLDSGLMPVNDYIITGDKRYADDFSGISKKIEEQFKAVEEIAITSEEREILKDVKGAWKNINEISLKIFAIPDPLGNKDAAGLMEEMDYKWGYPAIEMLKRWREIDLEEYKNVLEKHNMAWRQAWITMITGAIMFLVICLVYILFYSRIAARNEEELLASENRFRSLVEQLPNMVFINKKRRVVYANRKCEEVMKYKREEFYSPDFNFLSLIAPEYIEMVKTRFNRHIKGEEVEPYEYAIITKDNKRIEVILNTALIDYEGEKAILGILTDITERKKMKESLKISEERYRGLVETSTDAIISVNEAREIIQWNDSASKIFGYSKYEIMGKLIDIIIPEDYRNKHIEGFKRHIETGEGKAIGKTIELEGLRKDGFIVPIELSLSELKTGNSYIFTGIIRDLTERKQVEHEMMRQEKLAGMGQLAAGVAHEIKNPLNIISGNIQILDMEENDPEKKKIYKTVAQQIDRSVKIIDNLLDFARKRKHEIKDININTLLEKTIMLVEYEMRTENILFVRDFQKDLPMIKGDSDQIAQVFLNLINNARDSMNEKQKRIKSGKLKAEGWKGEIGITTKKTDNMTEIAFADTGLGIPEDKMANIFKPFFTTKAEGKGTGLGLSIAKDIIEKHGGKIELENKVGEGAKFIIKLPL
ncbi:MAG: PAS domain S-box protein [Nitrospinae bacterium]|nr:PAS domain S-box protein [Nitrospinota bacterium]MBI3814614.1 PAS domain S-box protein [Nitrospinota bacterium]